MILRLALLATVVNFAHKVSSQGFAASSSENSVYGTNNGSELVTPTIVPARETEDIANATGRPRVDGQGRRMPLYVAGLFGFGGSWPSGAAFLPAVEMGLEAVNKRKDILPGYELKMVWQDTQCNPGVGVDALYNFLYRGPAKLMIIGAGCSTVSEATAQASHLWGIVQLSYVSSSPSLSDKKRFPRFFRVAAPDMLVNPTRISMFQQFGWTKVATIHQSVELFSKVTEDLVQRMSDNNITLITSEIFTDNPELQIRNLKDHDARIIVGGFYLDLLGKVFCEAYKAGLYGPKYVWILVGWYDDSWWANPELSGDCTPEQVTLAAEGHFGTGFVYINQKQERGLSGLTSQEWKLGYDKRIGYKDVVGIQEASQGYDVAWAAAIVLNMTLTEMRDSGRKGLEDFSYDDVDVSDMIMQNMWKLGFLGIKGVVAFDENGDCPGTVKIRRLQDGKRRIVGYHSQDGNGTIEWLEDEATIWSGGSPPRDSTTKLQRSLFVSLPLYIGLCVLASTGIVLAGVFLAINIYYRKHKIIKMSSPSMNNVIVVGCIVNYTAIFLQELNYQNIRFCCKARLVFTMIGFSLAFGSLFAKTWRVYKIFTNTTKRTVLRDGQLFGIVASLVGLDVLLFTVREVWDEHTISADIVDIEEIEGGDVILYKVVHHCSSMYHLVYLATVFTIKGILLIFGAFLALQTRKVNIAGLNDSQHIGMCIYNVVLLSIIGVVLSFALTRQVELLYGCISGWSIFGTTTTLFMIFVPKIIKLKESMASVLPMDDTELSQIPSSIAAKRLTTRVQLVSQHLSVINSPGSSKVHPVEAQAKIDQLEAEISKLKSQMNG